MVFCGDELEGRHNGPSSQSSENRRGGERDRLISRLECKKGHKYSSCWDVICNCEYK
jgi:hypothetical protein